MALNLYPDITVSYKLNTAASTTMPTDLTALTKTGDDKVTTFSTLTSFLDPVANPNGAWIKLTNKNSHFNFVSTAATSDFGKMLFTYASTVYYCSADATTATAFTSSTPAATVGYNTDATTPTAQVIRDIYLHFTQAKLRQLTSACLKVQCSPRTQTVTIGGCIVQNTSGNYINNTATTGHLQVKYPRSSSDTSYSSTISKTGAYGYSATLNKVADHESGLTWKGWTTAGATGNTTSPSIANSGASYTIEPTGDVTYYGVWQRNTHTLVTSVPSITPVLSRVVRVKVYVRTPNSGSAGSYTEVANNTTYLNAAVSTTFSSFAAQTLSPVGETNTYKYVGYTLGTTAAPTDSNVTFTTDAITLASGSVTTAAKVTAGATQSGLYYGATAYSNATYTNASGASGFTTGATLSTSWSYSWSLDNTTSTIGATTSSNCSVVMRSNSTATLTATATENITGEEVHIIIQSIANLSATLTATNVFAY